jgi:hypothetical protein
MKTLLAVATLMPPLLVAAASAAPPSGDPAPPVAASQAIADHPEWDGVYTRAIRAATTAPELTTPLVDHLPASASVPTPLAQHGYIAGAPDRLSYASEIHAYMRSLAAASPRVKVFSLGTSEEGREMIAVAVADETTIAALDEYKGITRRLADPRSLDEAAARALIARGKPIYYLTGGLHSPESGSPEMLMELAYRLAVEDTPLVKSIGDNVITLITPVLEVDGRERWVDLCRWYEKNPGGGMPPFVYWGHYVAHDNNRDAVGLALALSRHVLDAYLDWHPQVIHDLHESIPFLYISSGTGPYNAWLDPLMVQEWERMAITEVRALTAMGLPGVWTHGFYDGWAPNYLFWVGMGRNSIGRFYETFGNHVPTTEDRFLRPYSTDRAWYRPNPPLPTVRWSLRDNVNYQESGVLTALGTMAAEREHFLEQFYRLGVRSVAKARTEGPAAYVFPGDQKRQGQLFGLMALLRRQGVEVQVAETAFSLKPGWPPAKPETGKGETKAGTGSKGAPEAGKGGEKLKDDTLSFPAGSFVVRMDQPYSRLADALLDTQYVRGEERVYDDTGWTLPLEANLVSSRIVNQDVLAVKMHPWEPGARPAAPAGLDKAAAVVVANAADTDLVRLRLALPALRMLQLDVPWQDGVSWPAGSVVIPLDAGNRAAVGEALAALHLKAEAAAVTPGGGSHELELPRVAILHIWTDTQDEGWYRIAFDQLTLPYAYISTQTVAATADLRAAYDVIVFPPAGDVNEIVAGLPAGPPLPWRKTELTPNLGVDATDDMRPGLGIAGVANLARFVSEGGVLLAVGDSARLAVDFGLARYVQPVRTEKLKARGSLLKARVADPASPLAYGYDETLPVYFAGGPVFTVGALSERRRPDGGRPSGRGSKSDPDVPQGRPWVAPVEEEEAAPFEEGFQLPRDMPLFSRAFLPAPGQRPRVVLAFPKEADTLLLSGMLEGGDEIAGKALVVDCPLGRGHVVLYGCNPIWRATTTGTYALVLNALLSWQHLEVGCSAAPAAEQGK